MLNILEEIGIAPYIWLVIAIAFFILEAATVQLISIWLGIGALVAILPASLKLNFTIQVFTFIISSIILIVLTKPLSKKFLNQKKIYHTNADSVIGKPALVVEEINNLKATGRVQVDGLMWSARSEHGEVIEPDKYVTVKSIEGVKVIVNQRG